MGIQGISDPPRERNINWFESADFNQLSTITQQILIAVCEGGSADNLYCRPTCCWGTICHCITSPTGIFPVNGTSCIDMNECEQDNGLCEDQCVNTQGSYFCSCGNGYQLGQNNRECQDINECNNPNTCSFGYVCVNTWGSYHCLTGAFATASVGADLGVIAGSATSSTNIIGIVVALALALVNVAVLGMLAARIVRMKRRQDQQPEVPSQSTKGAFRP